MKNNKKSNFLGLFCILTLFIIGIIVSCSTKDNDIGLDKILEDEIAIIEEAISDQFKLNYVGTYAKNDSAVIQIDSFEMPFTGLDIRISAITVSNNKLSLDISINGNPGAATLKRILFTEDDDPAPPLIQELFVETSTNAFLKNVYAYTTGDTIKGNNVIEIIVNPENGDLIFDGVTIATKK